MQKLSHDQLNFLHPWKGYIMIQCFRFCAVAKLDNLSRILEVFALISKPHGLGANYCIINTFHFKTLLSILPIIHLSKSYSCREKIECDLTGPWRGSQIKSSGEEKSNSLRLTILRDNSICCGLFFLFLWGFLVWIFCLFVFNAGR